MRSNLTFSPARPSFWDDLRLATRSAGRDPWRQEMGCRPVTAGVALAASIAGILLAAIMALPS